MSESELGGEIGLFYNTAGVMSLFGGVAEQAVDARLRSGSIHAMRTSDGVWVYPVFQFAGADIDPRLEPATERCVMCLVGPPVSGSSHRIPIWRA